MSTRVRIGIAGLTVSAVIVLLITLTSAESGSFHGSLARLVRGALRRIPPGIELTSAQFNFATNIVMFIPLGFFMSLTLGQKRIGAALASVSMTSAVIESIQFFLPTRGTQFEDILANSVGGWIGVGAALLVLVMVTRSEASSAAAATMMDGEHRSRGAEQVDQS